MEALYHFDVLPVHPPAEPLESLTSYLIRLAQENGITSVDGITAICFPSQDRRIARDFADYPPSSFEVVEASGVNRAASSRMTFFHLGMKFGRSPKPQPLSRFLKGSIAPCLRFCPHCLASQRHPYYSPLWRFLDIRCCAIHGCRLLDRCARCGSTIPLLATPLKIGICPVCKWDLKRSLSQPSPEAELSETYALSQSLEILLSPLLSDLMNLANIAKRIGSRFKYERKAREVTALEAARRVGVVLSALEGIEQGNVQGRGAKFQNYIYYTRFLGLSLRQLCTEVLQEPVNANYEDTMLKRYPLCPGCGQNNRVIRCGHNHSGSRRYRCQICPSYFTPRS